MYKSLPWHFTLHIRFNQLHNNWMQATEAWEALRYNNISWVYLYMCVEWLISLFFIFNSVAPSNYLQSTVSLMLFLNVTVNYALVFIVISHNNRSVNWLQNDSFSSLFMNSGGETLQYFISGGFFVHFYTFTIDCTQSLINETPHL